VGGKSNAAFIGDASICSLHEDIQAAYQSDPLFSKQKYTQRLKVKKDFGTHVIYHPVDPYLLKLVCTTDWSAVP
jgi:hypothetical protein